MGEFFNPRYPRIDPFILICRMADDIQQKTKKVEGSLLEAQDFENKLKEMEQRHHEERVQFQKQQHEGALTFEQRIKAERTEFLHSFEKQMQIR